MRYLVVSATAAEAAHVPAGLEVLVTGLGKTMAAAATARTLASRGDLAGLTVVNVGTAGALRDGLAGLHLPGRVINHDLSATVVRALGYDPHDELEVAGGDGTVLATGDVFVTDPAVRAGLAARADLVDMEGVRRGLGVSPGRRTGAAGQARQRQRRRRRDGLAAAG